MSVAMLIAALTGPRLAARRSPRAVARLGLLAVATGAVVVLATLDVELNDLGFVVGLTLFGVGAGLLASQLGNVIMSAAPPAQTNEAGGLQGTAQNVGASLGTALIGAVLLIGPTSGFATRIENDTTLHEDLRTEISAKARASGLEVVTVEQVAEYATAAGLPPDQVAAVTTAYGEAQLAGLRLALGAVALFSTLGLWFTRRLPSRSSEAVARRLRPWRPPRVDAQTPGITTGRLAPRAASARRRSYVTNASTSPSNANAEARWIESSVLSPAGRMIAALRAIRASNSMISTDDRTACRWTGSCSIRATARWVSTRPTRLETTRSLSTYHRRIASESGSSRTSFVRADAST